jgi:hypothetical protein
LCYLWLEVHPWQKEYLTKIGNYNIIIIKGVVGKLRTILLLSGDSRVKRHREKGGQDMMVYTYNPSYEGNEEGKIIV